MAGDVGTLGLLMCGLLAKAAGAAPLTLVDQGKTRVSVVLPARAIPPNGAAPVPAFEHHRLAAKDLGSQAPGNFAPSAFDRTPAVNRTGRNVLVLSLDNSGITELGTGGLVRPALLYAPK